MIFAVRAMRNDFALAGNVESHHLYREGLDAVSYEALLLCPVSASDITLSLGLPLTQRRYTK